MKTHRSPSPSPAAPPLVPPAVIPLLAGFRFLFTAPVWDHVLVLVAGTILAPGKRTVSAALRAMGLGQIRVLPSCAEPSTRVEPRRSTETAGDDPCGVLAQRARRNWHG